MGAPAQTATAERLTERELRAWRGLLRAHAALTKELDAELEAAHGLPLVSYEVLMNLAEAEGERMRMCDLAESVVLSRSGLTRLVDRLERDGLIERAQCPSDARGAYAVLTAAGSERMAGARRTHLAAVRERFLAHLSAEEQQALADVCERVASTAPDICGSDEKFT